MPVHFEVLKEIQHLPRTQIRKIQIADRRPSLCGNEPQQQNEPIMIASDGCGLAPRTRGR